MGKYSTAVLGDPQKPQAAAMPPKYAGRMLGDEAPARATPPPDMGAMDVAGEALSNIPASAAQFASDIVQPLVSPVETGESLVNLFKGAVQKIDPIEGQPYEKYADAVGEFMKSRYGGIEEFKTTIAKDPVGVLADFATVLTGGAAIPARATGTVGKIAQTVQKAGQVVDPLSIAGKGVKGVSKVVEPVVSNVVGAMTGTGAAPIRQAAQSGAEGGRAAKAFLDNMRGKTATDEVVVQAKMALGKMREARNKEYIAGMKNVSKDKTILDFEPIDAAITDVANIGVYKGQVIKPSTTGVMDEIFKAVEDWKKLDAAEYHTPEGLDALKQKIGDVANAQDYNTQPRVVADQVYNAIKQQIVQQAPDYAQVMGDYSQGTELIRDIEKALSLGKKTTADTALRKLTSVMRNNINTNFGARMRSAETLEDISGAPITSSVAGQAMSAAMPRGMAGSTPQLAATGIAGGMLTPWALGTLPLQSPRLVGEAAYYGGKGARGAAGAARRTGMTRTGPRMGLFQAGRESNRQNALADELMRR